MEEFEGHFEYRVDNSYAPEHGGIDWRSRWVAKYAAHIALENIAEVWLVSDPVEKQIHQDNCHIYLNSTSEVLDCIYVENEDESVYFFRHEISSFDQTVEKLMPYVRVIKTRYPEEDIVQLFLEQEEEDEPEIEGYANGE